MTRPNEEVEAHLRWLRGAPSEVRVRAVFVAITAEIDGAQSVLDKREDPRQRDSLRRAIRHVDEARERLEAASMAAWWRE